jgi:hypothetical protein
MTGPTSYGYDPYIVAYAWGTASGTFAVDTQVALRYDFSFLSDAVPGDGVPFYVQASLDVFGPDFYVEDPLNTNYGTKGYSSFLENYMSVVIPAGTEVYGWSMALYVGTYGRQGAISTLTVNIPANSVELVAFPSGAAPLDPSPTTGDVPEPATCALTAAGLALLLTRRLRHPV